MPETEAAEVVALTAPHTLEYTYTRSVGPVIGRFLGALEERRIIGVRARDGRVLVPPQEYDETGEGTTDEFVEVGQAGVVTAWTWIAEPRPKHPMQRPFAFALIRLDGVHQRGVAAVDTGSIDDMRTGLRVTALWRDERKGRIDDIECFVPEGGGT